MSLEFIFLFRIRRGLFGIFFSMDGFWDYCGGMCVDNWGDVN